MLTAEIIAIGSELLTPDRTDTNSLWLTERLRILQPAQQGPSRRPFVMWVREVQAYGVAPPAPAPSALSP